MSSITSSTAIVVLGHGSRSPEAKTEFLAFTSALKLRFPSHFLSPAFMELSEPAFPDVVAEAVAQGARKVIVTPCFLFHGNHIKKDIPELIDECRARHPGVEFVFGRHIGPDPRLAELVANRVLEVLGAERLNGPEIESQSMAIIETLLSQGTWSKEEYAVVKRLVHTAGDPLLATQVVFTPGACQSGVAALARKASIVADVKMVVAGIGKSALPENNVFCAIEEASHTEEGAVTRSEAGIRQLAERLDGAVVAIGNAPTALRALLTLVETKGVKPALVIGMPVGFVDAAESKEALLASGLPAIVIRGSRGGSPLAAATVNALAKLPS